VCRLLRILLPALVVVAVPVASRADATDGWFAEGYGGVAYIGSFKSENTPAFVFSDNLGSFKSIGDASSHEAGHTLSLRHDGTSERTYYSGHGGWGPIMGTSYSRLLAQWSRGEYDDASNDEHDVTELAERLGRRLDDHGDTSPTATLLGGTGETAGFIGAEDPVDVFVVDVVAGEINARVTPASSVSNLFASVTIRDTAGVVVAEHIPTAVTTKAEPATRPIDWAASATAVVPDGRYTVEVRPGGLGTPSTGFSTYGSRGAYVLTVALGSGSPPPSSGHPGQVRLTPIEPVRLADTRSEFGGTPRLAADGVLRVAVAGTPGVPADVTAAALNVTAVGPDTGGFLTVYPCTATVPTTSTVNFAAGRDIANSTIANLAADGSVCVYSSSAANVIVDITGLALGERRHTHVAGTPASDRRHPLRSRRIASSLGRRCPDDRGCGTTVPDASTLNQRVGEANANGAIVPVGDGATGCVYTSSAYEPDRRPQRLVGPRHLNGPDGHLAASVESRRVSRRAASCRSGSRSSASRWRRRSARVAVRP
jgi:hypothetical protein